ncbi:glycosyltransferase family 2 protein [Micrococcus luteus]|uniref:glycosyltransferase family 2 protein n=1 Tax=Micrococcus luteus TaxID=1270 RepID=UPI003879BF1C
MQPSLSVIIPCFHSGPPLRDQVEALRDQVDGPPREILLCDNGGNPGLRSWVEQLEARGGIDVRVVDATGHPGAAYARNRGIAEARAHLLAFCDDDDLVHPLWCRTAVDLLADYPVVTGGIVLKYTGELDGLDPAERRDILVSETVPVPPRPAGRGSMGPALMGGNFAARREVLLGVGGFDAGLVRGGEDNDLAYRLNAAGVTIMDCGAMSIIYSRPSSLKDRWRTRRRAGHALVEAVSARNAWDSSPELSRPPVAELAKAAAGTAAMAVGAKKPDWEGATDRVATAWGLTHGRVEHRLLGRTHTSLVGEGLQDRAVVRRTGTTVLVVAYNHAKYVVETLESIRQQTITPVRVLIADDASPDDDTQQVIRDWLATAPSTFEFHPNPSNIGLNPTLNRLLAMVDTEFVTYIAGDDRMRADRIEVHERLLRNSPWSVALAYSDARVIGANSEVLEPSSQVEFPWPAEPNRTERTTYELLRSNWIPAASIFLRTDVLVWEGGYDQELFYEDYELLIRLSARYRFAYTTAPLVDVRRLDTSLGAVGFAHDSPRFIRATFAALAHAADSRDSEVRTMARKRRWELAKRAERSGMPRHEVLEMMRAARAGAGSPPRAAMHITRAAMFFRR